MSTTTTFRFSLRAAFIAVTIFCCLCGFVAYRFDWIRARRQFISENIYSRSYDKVDYTEEISDLFLEAVYHEQDRPWWDIIIIHPLNRLPVVVKDDEVDWTKNVLGFISKKNSKIVRAQRLFPEARIMPVCVRGGFVEFVFYDDVPSTAVK